MMDDATIHVPIDPGRGSLAENDERDPAGFATRRISRQTTVRQGSKIVVIGSAAVPRAALRDWALRNVYEIYPVWRHRYAPGVTHNTEHVFGLTVLVGTPVRLNPREHLRHAWFPWREAADRCFSPSNAEAILQLPRFLPPWPR